jgi:hypothetical protein
MLLLSYKTIFQAYLVRLCLLEICGSPALTVAARGSFPIWQYGDVLVSFQYPQRCTH